MKLPRVVLIGGAPFMGKSSVARCISARYKYGCISTDDIGRAVGAVCPEINTIAAMDWQDYFTNTTVESLLDHDVNTRRRLWPAVKKIVQTHAEWDDPLVLEGYGLWPETVMAADFPNTGAIWLTCGRSVLEMRIRADTEFYREAADEEAFIQNFLLRSSCYNELMVQSANKCDAKVLTVISNHSVEDIADLCVAVLTVEDN